jgi:hypothetical protein
VPVEGQSSKVRAVREEGREIRPQDLTEPLREEMRLRLERAVGAFPPEEVSAM